ncbi:hypothetical protein EYZ11_005691 [Aspergillus tanneri]|nr:hypothetical protein EYZ11_005691 [Aspergillus tanneri]
MFQCPNCRAYTDLSAEVDDSNDIEEDGKQKSLGLEGKQSSSEETQTETRSPVASNHAANPSQSSVDHQTNDLPSEAGLAANIESMRLHDPEIPREAVEVAPRSDHPLTASNEDRIAASTDVPGWQALDQSSSSLQCRQVQLRSGTPVRSESSEENLLTPRNESGPLVFDGRAGMS